MKPTNIATLEISAAPYQARISICLADEDVRDWCLGLCLLEHNLIPTLSLTSPAGSQLMLTHDPRLHASERGYVQWEHQTPTAALATNEIQCWLVFALKYYRDGIGDVSHIDSELIACGKEDERVDIIITVPRSRPGISPAELDRYLDLLDARDAPDTEES
jgi:hypothetical protein